MESFFIDDDLTLTDTVPARPGLYAEFTFEYRPALPEKVLAYLRKIRQNPQNEFSLETELIAQHIVSWSIMLLDEPVKPSPDLLRRLHASARAHLLNAITGYTAPGESSDRKN
jgi:hypothetical protein